MPAPKVKHVFPGGNTPSGFVSLYDHIIPNDSTRIFILKGGPGTGKSTFMKKLGAAMLEKGYDLEFHHCSSDNNSLDGLVIPALKIALIDGTAPHIVDPKNPGCVDEILHLGDYWNEPRMRGNKSLVLSINNKIRECFQRAYRLLRAARTLYEDWEIADTAALDFVKANLFAQAIIEGVFDDINMIGCGKVRKLFASAITPDGPINYLESIIGSLPHRIVLTGDPGTGKASLLQKVCDAAIIKGLDVEAYYCPFDPGKIEHLVIPSLELTFTTSVLPHTTSIVGAEQIIDMNECLDYEVLSGYREIITYGQLQYIELFHRAVASLRQAKQLHDELETYYVPFMNFDGVNELWTTTYNRVLGYAGRVEK